MANDLSPQELADIEAQFAAMYGSTVNYNPLKSTIYDVPKSAIDAAPEADPEDIAAINALIQQEEESEGSNDVESNEESNEEDELSEDTLQGIEMSQLSTSSNILPVPVPVPVPVVVRSPTSSAQISIGSPLGICDQIRYCQELLTIFDSYNRVVVDDPKVLGENLQFGLIVKKRLNELTGMNIV